MKLALQTIGQTKASARRARNEERRGKHPTRRQRKAEQDNKQAVVRPEEPASKRAKKDASTKPSLMKGLAVGLNQVTRALERDEAAIVILCRSLKPQLLSQHIPVLCHQKGVPLCAIYDLSSKLGDTLGCRRLSAFAIRRPSTLATSQDDGTSTPSPDYSAVIEQLRPIIPVLHIPWLEEARYDPLQVKQVLAVPKLTQRKQPA
jgi:ribonuclease P/MRP protein subunit RPP38